ncbi:hypothetical protein LCGC14_2677270 [marine sediment metagenome]|uniref:ABC transmembrane type-1 domain-containing protein n=1 Tax=marine sediment metagenome TaxID=412755 RepID=A0A0F9BX99_9ZZZZ
MTPEEIQAENKKRLTLKEKLDQGIKPDPIKEEPTEPTNNKPKNTIPDFTLSDEDKTSLSKIAEKFEELTTYPLGAWKPPSPAHPLGQTENGRDVLGRMIWGSRSSLTIALPALFMALVLGTIVGVVAAYYGGWIDSVLMRIMDIFLAFPGLILILVFISIWGQQLEYFMLAYGILGIAGYSRLIRGSVLQSKELPYIQAAKVVGAKNWRIMFRHILPNCIQPVIISFTFDIGGIILSLAGLSFLGYGDADLIEWGYDIAIARDRMYDAPWAMLWPGVMIVITVLGFMLVGDGLRDALDPRMRNI